MFCNTTTPIVQKIPNFGFTERNPHLNMAFTGQTPESLLERSDSKNPATTCKGITKMGRPCRNPLRLNSTQAAEYNGVLAVTSVVGESDDEEIGAAAFFCHKHKNQAEQLVAANAKASLPQRQDTRIYPLKNRSSIDTLVAKLGVLEVDDSALEERRKRKEQRPGDKEKRTSKGPRRVHRPPTWDRVQGPLIEVPSDLGRTRPAQERPRPRKQSFWASLCCGTADHDDYVEMVRHKHRVSQRPTNSQRPQSTAAIPPRVQQTVPRPSGTSGRRTSIGNTRPQSSARPSETSNLLSYIPKTCAPQTASQLLAELTKPISTTDEEGYIYIFWLTPESAGPAPSSAASNLLVSPSRPEQNRSTSDILRQYSVRKPQRPRSSSNRPRHNSALGNANDESEKNTILLKIGRANNVHRRMHEWTRQCGYDLSLVRFYPYVSSTPSPSPQASPAHSRRPSSQNLAAGSRQPSSIGVRKVPYVKRVERLIHLELAEQRVVKQCVACGKEHREWFEVEASREGVKKVDEVVKRWVDWAEKAASS